jgi:acetyl coenzyme A synthetase (ADP forming)-like protein
MPNYKIARSEASFVEVVLRTGQRLRLRPITTGDKKKLEEFFYRLSPGTRYLRFGYTKSYISETELAYYTEIDPPQRYAYVATMGEGEAERIIAVGRWFLAPDGKSAEVAFAVEDNIQVRGIGTALLEQLVSAALHFKIKRFMARVLPENTRMLEVFEESGFRIEKKLDEGAYSITLDLEEQEEFEKRQAYREHIARSAGVRRLLYPRSVAVIGASRNPQSIGGALFRNILQAGFTGTVFPINPNATSVGGVLSYPTVLDVPGVVDMAVISVHADLVPGIVDQCGEKGVWGLTIISAGFGEAGPEGRERERKLREKVLSYGMRIIGPNCLGIMNRDPSLSLNATFSPILPPSGGLSIGSQSGALGLALLDYAKNMRLGVSNFISFGNRVDISNNDLLEFWEDDENTRIILLYLESFGNPRKFSRIARRVSRKKPVIAVKAGKSEAGAKAATSHTGALAAAEVAVEAMFRQAGVIRVDTIEEMFNVIRVLSNQPLPMGSGVGILTNAGGPGVLAADACAGWKLAVPPLSEETQKKLREFLPEEAALTNPVDMIASAPADYYRRALSIMLEDPLIHAVIVIYIPPLVTRPEDVAQAIKKVLSHYQGEKPVISVFMMMGEPVRIGLDSKREVPTFAFPEDAVQALARAYHYSLRQKMPEGRIPKFPAINPEETRKRILSKIKLDRKGKWLMPETCAALLKEYGIPVADMEVAMSAEEAARCAQKLGFPVAMKLRSDSILHKSEYGGVLLELRTTEDVKKAFESIKWRVSSAGRGEEMEGVVVQPMLYGGQEVITGMVLDPVFGPLIMTGLGGIQVELMKDVAFSLHPLTDLDPERLLDQLKSLPLLKGWRGRPPRDIDSLKDVLLRFSRLVEDFPEIEEMEINPLLVFNEGRGTMGVDARVLMKEPISPF